MPGAVHQPHDLQQFIDWLAPRAARAGGQDSRRRDRRDDATRRSPVRLPRPRPPGVNAIKNPSMETFNTATGLPQCYLAGGYGTNTPTWAVTTDAHTGTSARPNSPWPTTPPVTPNSSPAWIWANARPP